jgi:hypothetical protein
VFPWLESEPGRAGRWHGRCGAEFASIRWQMLPSIPARSQLMFTTRHGCPAFAIAATLVLLAAAPAQAQLRIVTYNTNNYASGQTAPRAAVATVLQALGDQAQAGFARPVDIFLFQEHSTLTTTTQDYVDLLNGIYGPGAYARGLLAGTTGGGGRPTVVYKPSAVSLVAETEVNALSGTGAARATLRYQFRPVGYDSAADFYVYNSHFKASDTTDDRARRGVEASQIRANADALGNGVHAIYAGDLNLYTSSEAAFVNFAAAGNGQAFDPVSRVGAWSDASSFRDVHTQSPVTSSQFDGQVTGGLDDRFDFQLVTGEVLDGTGFDYLQGSYWAFGNTGTHNLNGALSTGSTSSLQARLPGYTVEQTTGVINALMAASDHLPVVADYKLPARLGVAAPTLPTDVLRGATVSGSFAVSNAAPVAVAIGSNSLAYSISASGGLTATGSGSLAPLSAAASHGYALDTSTVGQRQATLTVSTTSAMAAAGPFTQNYTVNVLDTASVQKAAAAGPPVAFSGTYTFGSDGNVSSFAYNGTAIDDVTVGNLAKVGVSTSSSSGNFRASNFPTGATDGSNVFAGSLDPGKYFEFTLSAAAGHTLAMDSLSFGVGRSGAGPRQWQWRSSADGFATAIDTYTTVNAGLTRAGGVLTNPDSNSNWTGNVLDLSGAAYQGATNLTFRFYGFNAESTGGTGGLQGPLSFSGSTVETGGGGAVATLGPGDAVSLSNAAASPGTQRAAATIASRTLAGDAGWSVSGLGVGTSVAAGGVGSGAVAFADAGKLNGTYTATFTLGLQHDQSLPGATSSDVGELSWNLETTVVGRTGSGTAAVGGGGSYAGLGITSAAARGSQAALLAGTAADAASVSMSFAAAPEGDFLSDVLTLQGTAGDAIVLSLTYDSASLGDLLPADLFLGWLDTRVGSATAGEWVNSVLGNSANLVSLETAYLGSWEAYVAEFSPGSPAAALGAWGVDTSATPRVWAVVDHNSQFAVLPVPEPATWLLLVTAAAVSVRRARPTRSRRRRGPASRARGRKPGHERGSVPSGGRQARAHRIDPRLA